MPNIYHIGCHEENHEKNLQIIYSRNFSQIKIQSCFYYKACHTLCIMVMYLRINFCVIPENIHAQPKESHWKSQGRGALNPKTSLEKKGGGGRSMDIFWNHTFLEKPNITTVSPKFKSNKWDNLIV